MTEKNLHPNAAQPAQDLTHVRADGSAHMVDVTLKDVTTRTALAEGTVHTRADVIAKIFDAGEEFVRIVASVKTRGVTGVEMEALTAVSTAALTIFDMIKAVDKYAVISNIRVLEKSGGKSGDWAV